MSISNIITLFGGVALFLFGMSLMGEGLKKVAGSKLELVLYKLSNTQLKGMLLGAGVTAIIQSSSATSVMVVGFVNSGVMKVRQAMAVIMGAIVGTSITGWIICLSYVEGSGGLVSLLSTSTISALVAVIGIVLRMFSKKQGKRHVGDIMLGFAVLMFGMQAMSGAVAPLKDSPTFIRFMTAFSNPVLGILAGAAFTAVLQSASAAVGILQALSVTGAVGFAEAFPLLLGIAIGAAVPVLLSALGARTNGRRTAYAYLVLVTIGAVFVGAAFYLANAVVHFPFTAMIMTPVSIAFVNTVFRVICAVVLLPFLGVIEKLLNAFIKESSQEREANADFDRLDERFLKHPPLAVEQSRMTINAMARKSRENLTDAMMLLYEYTDELSKKVEQDEDLVDRYEDKIGTYLMKLNGSELNDEENERVSEYLHTLSDFERISDHAMNIRQVAQEIFEKKISFSESGSHELDVLLTAVNEILALSFTAFMEEDVQKAYRVEPLEEHIDVLCDELKLRHIERLQAGTCSLQVGFVFNDLITNLERVADHCSNIAIAMIELNKDEFATHDYVINLKELRSHNFDALYAEYAEKYKI
ncbi:MAG: Na/Pi cotransporter family protein [Oscillospiraceae bacterium]|nr:Na/Pi cotransporter family protein [Oscillospiraceae bacterium]